MPKNKMLKFVSIDKETPNKRSTDKRKGDFHEIYSEFINETVMPSSSLVVK